ncbi:hypothetical protein, partial [Cupriavidus laharis]|uniref:hypothetical protein n=1 Tax=Cupriavidus laharis TaxID=151654 RepID=UPI001CC58227
GKGAGAFGAGLPPPLRDLKSGKIQVPIGATTILPQGGCIDGKPILLRPRKIALENKPQH